MVEPETLSLFQQIGLFRQSRIVVGAPGAALCNAMFSTKDLTLFALGPDVSDDAMFANLMSIKDGRYMALHGTTNADGAVAIDPAFFEAMLTSIVDPR